MTCISRTTCALILVAVAIVSGPESNARQGKPNATVTAFGDLAEKIDAYLKPFVETNNFTGVVCVTRGGRTLFEQGYGMADYRSGVPNTPGTRFHIASVSKAFTAAAVLLLEEEGKLGTADSVSKFLPGYPNGGKIRLEHLLTHTSGIPNVNSFPEYDSASRFAHTLGEVVGMFRDRPLDFEPGSQTRYSNSNYNVLALIIEKVTGVTYGEFLETRIFSPLGLRSMTHDRDASKPIPNSARGTEPEGLRDVRLSPAIDWSIKTGNGSLVATARDLCTFAGSLFGGKLLTDSSLGKIVKPGPSLPYGWAKRERDGRRVLSSNGRSPGFISNLDYFPDDSLCIAILTNSYSSVGQAVAPDLSAIVFGGKVDPPRVGYITPREGELAAFAGRYQLPENYYVPNAVLTLSDRGGYLEGSWSSGAASVVYPAGGDDFVDRTFWAMVRFTRDPGGAVTGFAYSLLGEFTARKIGP